jgi:rare lipoprotein A
MHILNTLKSCLLFCVLVTLTACYYKPVEYQGHYKIGKPYVIKDKTYVPQSFHNGFEQIGVASWYGSRHQFHGKKTANGDEFNKYSLTAAHKTLPIPCVVKVTNLNNKKELYVMISDRGPFKHNRVIDVSEAAAQKLGFKDKGLTRVKVEYSPSKTKDLLSKLRLPKKDGARPIGPMKNPGCNIKCYMEKLNKQSIVSH